LANCSDCPLQDEGFAPGQGPDKAAIVIVGEAPGAQETRSGTPFSGPSGQLLNRVLESQGIDRNDVYVTNTVLCRPPGNANPPKDAIRACRARLVSEIRARKPNKVLTLGNIASQTLLNTRTGITTLRTDPGTESKELGATIVPTFHPAAALRTPDYLPSIVKDIGKLVRVQVGWEHTKFGVIDDFYMAKEQLAYEVVHAKENLVTCDIEVDVEDMKRIDPKHPNFLCLSISDQPGRAMVYTATVCNDPRFQFIFNEAFKTELSWGWQNGKFDIMYLWGLGIEEARVDEDTMLMHYATDERKGTHALETLAVEILGAPKYKTDARQYLPFKGASFRYIPPNVLYQYNAGDTDITHRLMGPLRKEMESDGTARAYTELLIPGANALARAEYTGVKVDRDRLSLVGGRLTARTDQTEAALQRWVDNPRSPIQVKRALSQLGRDVGSTDKNVLAELSEGKDEVSEFATTLLSYRKDAKLLSTYVKGMGKSIVRGRIHPTFLLHGTETGRLSCRRPNLQNIPSGPVIRDIFISGRDNYLLSADYSQIEFRLIAEFSKDPWLMDQFIQGREFHKEVALKFFGPNYTDLQYLRAKAVNFGLLYGRGAGSLAAEYDMPFAQAQGMVRDFFINMPLVKKYQLDLERQIKENGYLESYFGRKRRFWLVTKDNWHFIQKEGYNFPLQSTASDFTLRSLIRLEPLLRGRAYPVITVHDSLVFEVKGQYLKEVAHIVKEVMEDTGTIVPTPVELKVGTRWGDHKNKPCPDKVCHHLKEYSLG